MILLKITVPHLPAVYQKFFKIVNAKITKLNMRQYRDRPDKSLSMLRVLTGRLALQRRSLHKGLSSLVSWSHHLKVRLLLFKGSRTRWESVSSTSSGVPFNFCHPTFPSITLAIKYRRKFEFSFDSYPRRYFSHLTKERILIIDNEDVFSHFHDLPD